MGLLGRWRRWRERRKEARRIDDEMRIVVKRLEAGCPESELKAFACPVYDGTIRFEVVPTRPEALVGCQSHPEHLMGGVGYPYWARPGSMPSWWIKYRHPEIWDD